MSDRLFPGAFFFSVVMKSALLAGNGHEAQMLLDILANRRHVGAVVDHGRHQHAVVADYLPEGMVSLNTMTIGTGPRCVLDVSC